MFFFFICFCLFFFGEPSTSLPPSLQPPPPFPFPPPKNMGFRSRCWKQVLPNLLSVLLRLIDPSFGATPRRPPIPPPSDRGYSYRVSAVAARTAATGLVASSAATVVGMAIGRSPRAYAVPVAANVTIVGAVMFGTRGCSCVNGGEGLAIGCVADNLLLCAKSLLFSMPGACACFPTGQAPTRHFGAPASSRIRSTAPWPVPRRAW